MTNGSCSVKLSDYNSDGSAGLLANLNKDMKSSDPKPLEILFLFLTR